MIRGPVKFVMVTVSQQSSDEHFYLVFSITLRKHVAITNV